MASTSVFEIGFAAAAETVDIPADEAGVPAAVAVDEEGAEVLFAEPADEGGAEEPAAAVTVAACLEPKMADTILPKTLICSSYVCACSQTSAATFLRRGAELRPSEGHTQAKERLARPDEVIE